MGFLDKAKENLEKVAKQGQDKLDEVQSKKKADGLLRDLGAWTYASSTGRDNGQGPSEVERITAELHAHEAEHGPLGGDKAAENDAGPPAATDAPSAPPAQVSSVPPAPMADSGSPAGSVPPPPVFSPPPPPPPATPPLSGGGSKLDEF